MDAQTILVIMLSITLFIFLVLSIIIAVYVYRIVKSIRVVSEQAEKAATNVASFSQIMKKSATPAAVSGVLASFIKRYTKK